MAKNNRPELPSRSFSERHNYRPVRSVFQVDSIDEPLRNGLLTALDSYVLTQIENASDFIDEEPIENFLTHLWVDHYKLRLKSSPENYYDWRLFINDRLANGQWYEFYDFIEYSLQHFPFSLKPRLIQAPLSTRSESPKQSFKSVCNHFLKREMSAWRIVGYQVVRLTSEEEIETVEKAYRLKGPVRTHIATAVGFISDRKNPNYRNSIKESISAVEAMCCKITGRPKATLGEALKTLENNGIRLHGALKKAFGNLYGYTSDADGIRHSLMEDRQIDFEDAKFMLISCSAFVNCCRPDWIGDFPEIRIMRL